MSKQQPNPTPNDDDELREIVEGVAEAIGGRIASEDELAEAMAAGELAALEHDARARQEARRFVDEETDRELIDTWWREAKECQSIDAAADLARRLVSDYRHDYGTICHAIAVAAIAMAHAVERSPEGGITGFQAGAVSWMLLKHWNDWPDGPRRIVDYANLLYPAYDHHFTEIDRETANWLTRRAQELLAEHDGPSGLHVHPHVRARWESVAAGRLPSFVRVVEQ